MKYRRALSSAAATAFLAVLLAGCETQLDIPAGAALTLQTKNATEVLPAEARYVGMVNLQEMQRNQALSPLMEGLTPSRLSGEGAARLQDFLEATGFDPEKDIREVYLAMDRQDDDGALSLALYANFDRDRLQAYVDQHLAESFETVSYRGIPVHRSRKGDRPMAFAVASDNMIVASSEERDVHAMLDRLTGQGRALKDNAEMMALIQQAETGSAWFVARGLEHGTAGPEDLEHFGLALQDVAVSVDARPDRMEGHVLMVPRSGVSAGDLADLTKGMIAAMKTGVQDAEKRKALDRVRVREAGEQVRVQFEVANEALRKH